MAGFWTHFECEFMDFINELYVQYQKKRPVSKIILILTLYSTFTSFAIFLMFQISRYHDVEINEVLFFVGVV